MFVTTRWSVVLAAGLGASSESERALAQLYRAYWYPLALVRRQGHSPQDAEDLTQGFFAHLLEKKALGGVKQEKGKFRSFLLAALKNFLANDWDRQHAAKRGGPQAVSSLDDDTAEDRYLREPSHDATPEKLFEQSWALTVLETVLQQLRKEYTASGKAHLFEALQEHLIGDEEASYASAAAELGMMTYRDGGVAHRDGGMTYRDSGVAYRDGGMTYRDSGVAYRDGGVMHRDEGVTPSG